MEGVFMRKRLRFGVLVFLFSLFFTVPVFAGNTDGWISGWDYVVQGGDVVLSGYRGSEVDLDIYGKVRINGSVYNTVIYYDEAGYRSAFTGNAGIRSIVFHPVSGRRVCVYGEYMANFFQNMTGLREVSFSDGFDSSGITDFTSMCKGCAALVDIDAENLDMSSATTLNSMFSGCKSLEAVELPDDLSSLEVMSYLCEGCSSLRALDLSGKAWASSGVTMSQMISKCPLLSDLIVDERVKARPPLFGFCSESKPTRTRIIGKMSPAFESYVFSKLKDGKRYIESFDVRAGVSLVGDDTYDRMSYALVVSGLKGIKTLDNDGSDEVYFDSGEHGLFIYQPGEYHLELTQGFRDEAGGVVAVGEAEDGFRCENPVLSMDISVSRNVDGSVIIEAI